MSDQIKLIEHFVEEFNRGKLHAVDHHLLPDSFASPPAEGDPTVNESLHQIAQDLKAAMPDLTIELTVLSSEGDFIQGRAVFRGTHENDLWGAPGSGNQFSWDVKVVFRTEGDRFAFKLEDLDLPDLIGAVRQLGMVNPPDMMDQPLTHPIVIPEFLVRAMFTGSSGDKPCRHLDGIEVTEPDTDVCAQCVELGDVWPALRASSAASSAVATRQRTCT